MVIIDNGESGRIMDIAKTNMYINENKCSLYYTYIYDI